MQMCTLCEKPLRRRHHDLWQDVHKPEREGAAEPRCDARGDVWPEVRQVLRDNREHKPARCQAERRPLPARLPLAEHNFFDRRGEERD